MAELSDYHQHELEKLSRKDNILAILFGIFLPPVAYIYVGKWDWAAVNFITLNYLLFSFALVPVHYHFINCGSSVSTTSSNGTATTSIESTAFSMHRSRHR